MQSNNPTSSMNEPLLKLRIAVIGDAQAGKTTLINTFITSCRDINASTNNKRNSTSVQTNADDNKPSVVIKKFPQGNIQFEITEITPAKEGFRDKITKENGNFDAALFLIDVNTPQFRKKIKDRINGSSSLSTNCIKILAGVRKSIARSFTMQDAENSAVEFQFNKYLEIAQKTSSSEHEKDTNLLFDRALLYFLINAKELEHSNNSKKLLELKNLLLEKTPDLKIINFNNLLTSIKDSSEQFKQLTVSLIKNNELNPSYDLWKSLYDTANNIVYVHDSVRKLYEFNRLLNTAKTELTTYLENRQSDIRDFLKIGGRFFNFSRQQKEDASDALQKVLEGADPKILKDHLGALNQESKPGKGLKRIYHLYLDLVKEFPEEMKKLQAAYKPESMSNQTTVHSINRTMN